MTATQARRRAITRNLSGTTFVLLPNEDRAAFDALVREYTNEWSPRTPHETFLVTQMVQARWRLNRIARMEAQVYDAIFTMPFAQGQADEGAIVMAHPLMNDGMLDKLHRYAKDAERSYNRAVKELRAYRAGQRKTSAESATCEKIQNEPNRPAPAEIMSIFEQRAGDLSQLPPETRATLEDLAAAGIY